MNRYGHPGKNALEGMDVLGITNFCTIDCGQITVKRQEREDMLLFIEYINTSAVFGRELNIWP